MNPSRVGDSVINQHSASNASDRGLPPERAAGPPSQTVAVLRIILLIVGVAGGLWVLHRLASVILVLILAAIFAYVITPLVQLAERPILIAGRKRRLSRGAAIAVVYVLMAGGASATVVLLLPSALQQTDDIISRAPAYAQSILTWEHGWSRYYERLRIPVELRHAIDQFVVSAGETAVATAQAVLVAMVRALSNLPWLVLIPIVGFFLLKDAVRFRRNLLSILPHRFRLRGYRLVEEVSATLAAYIRAQLFACLLVGTLCGVGFALLGIPYAVLLGVLAGVLEFIPLVGPLLLALVASIISALHDPILVFSVVGFLGVLRLVEDYIIYPRLIRRGLHLHPLAVIVAVLAGAELNGVAGIFLAVPTAAIATVIYRHWAEWRGGNGDGATGSAGLVIEERSITQ